jgi:diguanylate cyclase (GGDEF)-like protein
MRELVARVMDPRLADLLALWRRSGTEGADPAALLAGHGDHLLVIEAEGPANRYAHYGKAFAACFGNDLTGQVIDLLPPEILPADRRFMLEFEYGFARRAGRPLWRSYTALFGRDLSQTWQRLVLPAAGGRLVVGAYPAAEGPDAVPATPAETLLRLLIDRVPVVLAEDGGIADLALSLDSFADAGRQMAELEQLASRDPLTGISNRRHFERLAGLELDHARRMGRSFALLALDIDHFKRINDNWGHAAGDEALKAFAGACARGLREYDILGRIGGEEFAVALPNTGMEGAKLLAERLRAGVEQLVVRLDKGVFVDMTVSVGIAVLGEADTTVTGLLDRADRALYRAKEMGRNQVRAEG